MKAAFDSELPQGDQKAKKVRAMFDSIAPRYDVLNRVIALGLDRGWRTKTVRSLKLRPRSVVIDVACGTGDLCNELQRHSYTPIGLDMSRGMLAKATTSAPLVQGDALDMAFDSESVDGITSGFALRNFVSLEPAFLEMARVLKPGGRVALLDIAHPDSFWLAAGHNFYLNHIAPLIGSMFSDAAAYHYLPKSLAYLPSKEELIKLLEASGFKDVEHLLLSKGLTQLLVGTKQ